MSFRTANAQVSRLVDHMNSVDLQSSERILQKKLALRYGAHEWLKLNRNSTGRVMLNDWQSLIYISQMKQINLYWFIKTVEHWCCFRPDQHLAYFQVWAHSHYFKMESDESVVSTNCFMIKRCIKEKKWTMFQIVITVYHTVFFGTVLWTWDFHLIVLPQAYPC